MSSSERYGTLVWQGLLASTVTLASIYVQWATVGEVASAAGVSKPTARKYLNELVDMGRAESMKFGNSVGYAVTSGMEN